MSPVPEDMLPRLPLPALFVKLAIQHEPDRNVGAADQRQETPPPG